MEIRELVAGDAPAWWQIRLESLESEPFAFGKAAEEHRTMTLADATARFGDVPEDGFYLGAFEGDTLIGTSTFIRETGLKERHKGHIYGVYVTAAHRRNGVGRALIAALLDRATRIASLEQILLSVATSQDAAQALYRSLGFERYGTEPHALKVGSTYIDEDHLILRLH